jgi:DNA-binding HxlR family transcriptional regulator
MRRTRFNQCYCSMARVIDLLGDWWTPLVLRECFYGIKRFGDFEARLGIGKNILTQRLERLVRDGLLQRTPYQQRPVRHEYTLTPMGRDFFPVICALLRWGDDWLAEPEGPAMQLVDRQTGQPIRPVVVDQNTGKKLEARDVTPVPGPGLPQNLHEEARRYFAGAPLLPTRSELPH